MAFRAADQSVREIPIGGSLLLHQYQFRDYETVAEFVRAHKVSIDFLLDIAHHLQGIFPDAPLFAEVVTDPEEGTQQLLVSVATDLAVEEALDRLDRFDKTWWLDNMDRSGGRVCVDIEDE